MTDRPELTIAEAAKACAVSAKTIRRRLDANAFPAAHRLDGPAGAASGPWVIPIEDLIGAGLRPGKPSPPDPPEAPTIEADPAELDRLKRENADLRRRAEVAEAVAHERERTIEAQALALKMLEAATPPEAPEGRTERRRWFSRRR